MSYNLYTLIAISISGIRFIVLGRSHPEQFVHGLTEVGFQTLVAGFLGLFFDQIVPGFLSYKMLRRIKWYLMLLYSLSVVSGLVTVILGEYLSYQFAVCGLLGSSLVIRGVAICGHKHKIVHICSLLYSVYLLMITVQAVIYRSAFPYVCLALILIVSGEMIVICKVWGDISKTVISLFSDEKSFISLILGNLVLFCGSKMVEYGDKVACSLGGANHQIAGAVKLSSLINASASISFAHLHNDLMVHGKVPVGNIYKSTAVFCCGLVFVLTLSEKVGAFDFVATVISVFGVILSNYFRGAEIITVRSVELPAKRNIISTLFAVAIMAPIFLTKHYWVSGNLFIIFRSIIFNYLSGSLKGLFYGFKK